MMYEAKVKCARCAGEFIAHSPIAKFCPECRVVHYRQKKNEWSRKNRRTKERTDKDREYEAQYREKNRERIRENAKAWYHKHHTIKKAIKLSAPEEAKLLEEWVSKQDIHTETVEVHGCILTLMVCTRMNLKTRELPCGDRYECFVKPVCKHVPPFKTPLEYGEHRGVTSVWQRPIKEDE